MNVSARTSRLRQTARGLSGGSGTVWSEEFTGLWIVQNLQFTAEIAPGKNVPISFEINSQEDFHDPTRPNTCFKPNGNLGSSIRATLLVDGQVRSAETRCVRGGTTDDFQLAFIAGQDGVTHNCAIELRNATSGEANTRREFAVHVTDGAAVGDCPPGFQLDPETDSCVPISDNGDGGGGDGGGGGAILPCFIDPNRGCATPEMVAWAGVGTLLLVAVASR